MALDASPVEETSCPNCGSSVLAKWAFCRHCGIALNSLAGAQWEPVAEPLLRSRRRLHAALDASSQSPSTLTESHLRQDLLEDYRRGKQEMSLEKSALHFIPAEVEKQIVLLEHKVAQVTEGDSNRIGALSDQVKRLEEGLHAIRVAREIHDERRRKEHKMLESSFATDLEKAASERKQFQSTWQAERGMSILNDCRADLTKEHEQKGSVQEEYVREIGEEVQRLHVLLEKQHVSRLERGEQILVKLEADFQQVHNDIETEQKLRFEAEGMMLRMVEDVCGRLHGEIEQERLQREAVQNKLLGLLEDTCTQIENSFSYLAKSKGL
eukprot:s699_g25.t1